MKALILDVDGVLNSTSSCLAKVGKDVSDWWHFTIKSAVKNVDPVAVGLVNRLLDKSGAKLVLGTSQDMQYRGYILQ